MIEANQKWIAFPQKSSVGGIIQLLAVNKGYRITPDMPILRGHEGSITDLKFFPYNNSLLATASEDANIHFWQIPEEMTKDLTEPLSILKGLKKINLLDFNQTSEGILASSSIDGFLRVWDANMGEVKHQINIDGDHAVSMLWNSDGNLLGSTWKKDKQMRIADIRS